jgi:diguanylate cyclase (GGDEF)-like protein
LTILFILVLGEEANLLGNTQNLRRNRNTAFNHALIQIQPRLTVVNAVFIWMALGMKGAWGDYLLAGVYLIWSVFLFFLAVRDFSVQRIRGVFQIVDLLVACYMIHCTGGLESPLYPFLFIPVLATTVRCRYSGIIAWSTVTAFLFAVAAITAGPVDWVGLVLKIGYLYMFGIFGGFLIGRTYMVAEEVSNQLARENSDLKRLTAHLNQMAGSSDLDQVFDQTFQIIQQNCAAPMLAIMVFDEHGILKIVKTEGWSESVLQHYHSYSLTRYSLALAPIMAFKKPVLSHDISEFTELAQAFDNTGVKSLFLFPLEIWGEVEGVLSIAAPRLERISEEEVHILTSIVKQAGITIKNVLSLNEEKKRADTDGLTGLYNRRYFNEQLERLAGMHLNQGDPLSLLLIDVDNFKKYNDAFGHPEGDLLLKKVARLIKDLGGEHGIAARYGGEEFAVILPGADTYFGLKVAERIRAGIESIRDLKQSVTVSVGLGTLPDHATDWRTLIEYSDKSLYHAKNHGKNRVCCGYDLEANV